VKNKKTFSAFVLCTLLFIHFAFSMLVIAAEHETVVRTEEELIIAISNQAAVIVIDELIPLSRTINIRHAVTLKGSGVITVADEHRHFDIFYNGHLTLDGDITLTRAAGYTGVGGGVHINLGVFTLYSGHIYNNHRRLHGGGISLFGGRAYIKGGTISHNQAFQGGGVYINVGYVILYSGTVSDNRANFGGGIYMGFNESDNRTLIMRGGLITDNTADFVGGGIHCENGTVYLLNGAIQSNRAAGHGGVYLCIITQRYVSTNMVINENTPVNRYDTNDTFNIPWYTRVHIFSWIHLLALLSVASVGIFLTKRNTTHKKHT